MSQKKGNVVSVKEKKVKDQINYISKCIDKNKGCQVTTSEEELKILNNEFKENYVEYIKQENFEACLQYNRVWAPTMRTMSDELQRNMVFDLGALYGMYVSFSDMIPDMNDRKTFLLKMSQLIDSKYVKKTICFLYQHQTLQNKILCELVTATPSQMNRVTTKLKDVGCVYKYTTGKYVFWQLTHWGKYYAKSVLGTERETIIDFDDVRLLEKPSLEEIEGKKVERNRYDDYNSNRQKAELKYVTSGDY